MTVPDRETDGRNGVPLGEPPERCGQRDDRFVDELDAAVRARQRVEDVAVEDEGAPDPPGRSAGVVERGMVLDAQVAAEPDQRGVEGFVPSSRRLPGGSLPQE
jgi:hypothetical protein